MVTTNYLQHDTSWYYVANIEKITLGGSPWSWCTTLWGQGKYPLSDKHSSCGLILRYFQGQLLPTPRQPCCHNTNYLCCMSELALVHPRFSIINQCKYVISGCPTWPHL